MLVSLTVIAICVTVTLCKSVWLILLHPCQFDWYYYMQVSLINIATYGSVWLILLYAASLLYVVYFICFCLLRVSLMIFLNTDHFAWCCYIWVSFNDIAICRSDWVLLLCNGSGWMIMIHMGQFYWYCHMLVSLTYNVNMWQFDWYYYIQGS